MVTFPGHNALGQDIIAPALAYWDRVRGDRAMPARADINPAEIPQLLQQRPRG